MYRNFSSYRKHVYRKHRQYVVLDDGVEEEDDLYAIILHVGPLNHPSINCYKLCLACLALYNGRCQGIYTNLSTVLASCIFGPKFCELIFCR